MQSETTTQSPMNFFSKIIGQYRAKMRLSESISSAMNDGEMISPLIIAEAGVGKTAVMRAYANGLESVGVQTMFFNSPEEFRERDLQFNQLIELIQSPGKIAVLIDEAHLINFKATRQTDLIRAFLMKAMDGNNQGKFIQLNDEISFVPDRKRIMICLATNFPDKLDRSNAMQSRFDKLDLDLYTKEELIEILQLMLHAKGFRHADSETLGIIANCGRGTARPMEKIVDQLVISRNATNPGKTTINRAEVIRALQLVQYFLSVYHQMQMR
jgi:SpoVK/Ycf46/Vps4 family AAA+-type ATPase